MQQLQILVLEGNPHLCSLIAWQLQQIGHHVQTAETIAYAKECLQQAQIHLLILDADLSNRSGLKLCSWAYRYANVLIIILSSRDAETDIIAGLEAGADEYLTKPFSMQVLSAKVQALARRCHRSVPPSQLYYGDLKIDLVQRRVIQRGQEIDLTPQEFSLLFVLVQAGGDPLSRTELLERAWPDAINNPRTVDTHILSLRKKLELDPRQPNLIQTVRNVGYCFNPNQNPEDETPSQLSRSMRSGRDSTQRSAQSLRLDASPKAV